MSAICVFKSEIASVCPCLFSSEEREVYISSARYIALCLHCFEACNYSMRYIRKHQIFYYFITVYEATVLL